MASVFSKAGNIVRLFVCTILFALVVQITNAQKSNIPLYKQANAPADARVKDLLGRMTLDEKIAQLRHLHSYQIYTGQELDGQKLANVAGNLSYGCVEGFTLTGPNCNRAMYAIQQYMREKTRLGIPVLTVTESLHGSVQDGSTIFPQSVALGSTFNTDLAYKMTAAIAAELKAQGMWQSLSPGMDVVRDLRWGRVEESFGEDPWLVGKMGVAETKGYLDNGISPMLKPFGAGGAPSGGLNLASVDCGERDLRDIYLKPYEMVVKSTGVMAVMSSYNSWNRVPNSASHFLLTDILRKEWSFKGYVYSDWAAVSMLKDFQHTARTYADAAKQALTAGLDLEASSNCYAELKELIEKGNLDIKYINQAVARILWVKFKLGLFENPYPPAGDTYKQLVHSAAAVNLSRQIADESIVLLKNEQNLLPLDAQKIKSIAVIGPNAGQVQFGDYTWSRDNNNGITPLKGLTDLVGDKIKINYAPGCDLTTQNRSGIQAAVEAANNSDVSVVFVGSSSASLARNYSNATTGEGFDLSNLDLTGVQEDLIKSVQATGKRVVVVLVTGKPFSIPWVKNNIPAIVVQWYAGERGGDAIADMLFGKTNPSAKLPFSFPQSVGHLPVYYNYLPTDKGYYHQRGSIDKPGRDYVFSNPDALWGFGYGLSYTSFKLTDIALSDTVLGVHDTLKIKLKVNNTGAKDGKEVVQLYIRNLNGSVVTPVKQLKDFAKPFIAARGNEVVNLTLPVSELALYNTAMKKVVEPGDFEIQVGDASDHIIFKKIIHIANRAQVSVISRHHIITAKPQPKTVYNKAEILTIDGDIRDVQATPVVNVIVKSVKLGKQVNADGGGKYAIQAYANDMLIFSAPGYEQTTVEVKNQKNINVRMNYKQN